MRGVLRFAGPLALFVIATCFYWRLTVTGQHTWLAGDDIIGLELPRLQFMASEWHHLRFPAWDPYHWNGQPFLGQITGAAAPLNWLFALLGFHEGKIRQDFLHWYFVLLHYLAALFTYALCRDLGSSRLAAILGGCLYGFAGYMGTSDWPTVMNGVLWAPLVLLFALRDWHGPNGLANAAWAGTACGLAWLSGHHQAPYYLSLVLVVIAATRAAAHRSPAIAIRGATALLFTACVGGLQLLPGWEYGRLAVRWAGPPDPLAWNQKVPFSVHEHYSFRPADLLSAVMPAGGHVSIFLGVAGLTLAIVGVWAAWHRPPVRILASVAAAGLLLAMASHNWVYGVLYAFTPLMEKARVPARIVMLFCAAAAPLAALGVDAVRSWPHRVRAAQVLAVAAGAGFIAGTDRTVWFAIGALATAVMFARAAHPAWFIALALIEVGNLRGFAELSKAPSAWGGLWTHRDVAQYLKAQPQPIRVDFETNDISYNFGAWHSIETTGGFLAGITSNLWQIEWHSPRVHDLLAVTHLLSKQPTRPEQQLVFRGAAGVNVYRNPNAFPRAFLVHQSEQAPNRDILRERLSNVDLRRTALLLETPPSLAHCEGDEPTRWLDRKPASFELEVDARCRGLLIVSDTYYPGWRATVDGRPAPILEVNGSLRGVVLESGRHRVRMAYRPWTGYAGAAMTLTGLAAALALARSRKRSC